MILFSKLSRTIKIPLLYKVSKKMRVYYIKRIKTINIMKHYSDLKTQAAVSDIGYKLYTS